MKIKTKVITGIIFMLIVVSADARSQKSRHEFIRDNPCPGKQVKRYTCPGYVIDHVIPLACGGEDLPRNMQWQTIADGKLKDKWERKDCSSYVK